MFASTSMAASRRASRGAASISADQPQVTGAGPMPISSRLPRAGRYAVAVRHDVDGDGNDWGDGGGFSRNPRISLTNLRPGYNNVAFNVGQSVQPVNVVLNYRFGLSIRPVG